VASRFSNYHLYLDILKSLTNEELLSTIESLSQDKDSDVHSFFAKTPNTLNDDLISKTIDSDNQTDTQEIATNPKSVINVDLLNDSLNILNLGNSDESTTGEHSS